MKHNFFVRFLSLFLAVIMTVTLLPLSIMAEDLAASSGEEENMSTEELISDISESSDGTEVEYTDPAPGLDEVRPTGEVYYTEEGLALRLNSDSASYSVVGFINAAATSVTIPDNYDGKPVTHIGDSAFKDKANLKNVTIGANMVYIGDDVFGGCPLVFNVLDGVNYIGTKDNMYFYAHSSVDKTITEYTAPAETRIIGSYAFHNCTSLKKFELHADIIQVGFRSLRGCDSIEEVTLPFAGEVNDGTANVHVGFAFGARTYGGNISFVPLTLKRLTILGGSLQKNALYGIDNVTHLGLPTMTAHLGYYYGAETYEENINYIPASLTSVSVQSGAIPKYAFYECVKIENVNLPTDCKRIGNYAFYRCENLIEMTIPDSITSIGSYAYYNCFNIKSIAFPNGLQYIWYHAFENCTSLVSVTIPHNTTVLEFAFSGCSGLVSAVIGGYVDRHMFSDCTQLQTVIIEDGVTGIGEHAFTRCKSLASITIPDSVTSIDYWAFALCSNLVSIEYTGTYAKWQTISKDVTWDYDTGTYTLYCLDLTISKDGENALLNGSTVVASNEFSQVNIDTISNENVYELSNASIEYTIASGDNIDYATETIDNVEYSEGLIYTSNGDGTCYVSGIGTCTDSEIVIPSTSPTGELVIAIGERAFSKCNSFSRVDIPEGVLSIGNYAFGECAGNGHIVFYIPSSINYIGQAAFYLNASVDVHISDISKWCQIDFADSNANPLSLGSWFGRSSLYLNGVLVENLVIPEGVTEIKQYAFFYYTKLKSVSLPNSVVDIGQEAFFCCSSLVSIAMPNNIISVAKGAFQSCSALKSVYIYDVTKWVQSIFDEPSSNPLYNAADLFVNGSIVTDFKLPDSLERINLFAFYNCSSITSIFFGKNITSLDSLIFYGCSNLSSITFADETKIRSIDSQLFAGTSLTDVYYSGEQNAWRFVQKATDWDEGRLIDTPINIHFAESGSILYDMKDDKSEFYVSEFVGTENTVIPEIYSGRPVTLIYDKSFYKVDLGGATVSVTIPESVKTIYSNAFYNSPGIGGVHILGTELELPRGMITGCESLYELTVPFLGAHLGDTENNYLGYLFGAEKREANGEYLPKMLKTVTLTDETYIPKYAFAGCSYLEKVNFLADVTYIGEYAFSNCLALKEFVIPDSVEEIGVMIFDNCDGLKTITIGNKIKSIPDVAQGNPAFGLNKASSSLEKYIISDAGNDVYSVDARGVLYEKHPNLNVEVGVIDAPAKSDLLDYVLPDHIVYIAPYAFAYNTSLRWIQLDRVRRIDKCAFFGATSLIAAVFGQKGVDVNEPAADTEAYNAYLEAIAEVSEMKESYYQFIGEQAFAGCLQLRYVNLYSDFIIHIGDLAFFDCESLENIYLSSSLQSLGHRVFDEAMPEYIEVEEGSEYFKSVDGVLYRNTESGYILELYPARKVTAESYESNGEKEKEYETYFALPEDLNVVSVQSYAFADSAYLAEVDLSPASDMIIGDYAFSESNVRVVNIGDKVTSIGLVRGEGEYTVFADCMQLSKINVSKNNPYYSSQNGVLFDKLKYKLIKYPVMKTDKEYSIPSSVSIIASMAFKDCGELVILAIPSYINTIGLEAFYGARNLSCIYFNHVYAPMSVMENAFTTSTEIDGTAYDPRTMILYSAGYYENGADGEYGWVNYDGVYNIHECTAVPKYNPAQAGKVYYAVVVVDSTGMPLDNISVTLTDPNGVSETIVTGYSNSSQTGLSESGDGIAMFYDLYGTEGMGFAIDFEQAYTLSVVDNNGKYYTYMTDTLMLDSDMCITYVTLSMQPSVYGVDLAGKDINTETAVLNKAEYGQAVEIKYTDDGELDFSNIVFDSDGNVTGFGDNTVSESVEITVIAYYDSKAAIKDGGCMLYQNGAPIPGCTIVEVKAVGEEAGVSHIVFDVPVDQLIPEVSIEVRVCVEFSTDGSEATATSFLNIDVIDFTLTADDIKLDASEIDVNLSSAGDVLANILGSLNFKFKLGDKVKLGVVTEGTTAKISLNAEVAKKKNSKSSSGYTGNYEEGYKTNHTGSTGNTYFFPYHTMLGLKKYTFNIRFARGTEDEGYYYYQAIIYEGDKADSAKEKKRFFGVVNASDGRSELKLKSMLIYYNYMVGAKSESDIKKGSIYIEPLLVLPTTGSTTKHDFSVTMYGDIRVQYDREKGLDIIDSTIKGEIKYTFYHGHQFVVWVIPIYVDVTVNLKGELEIKIRYDEGISLDEVKLTVMADVTAKAGIGCNVLSAGVMGKLGMIFVLEFYPDPGVETLKLYGGIYAYVTYVTIKFKKVWGINLPVIGSETKQLPIIEIPDDWYIIGGPEGEAGEVAYYAMPMAALYMADAYGAADPTDYTENATIFTSGGKIYKLGFVNMYGSVPTETEGEYDEYNYLKLALFEWDSVANGWGDYKLIDDNGYNDFYYSVVETENGAGVIFTQQTEKTNADSVENSYDYVSDLVVKYVDLSNITSEFTVMEVWENEYYKYLPSFNIVNGNPVAVWAQNSDNNMFGISPKNYIDSKGNAQIFSTDANSIWTSSLVNGVWTDPVCVVDGLSAVMDITVTEDGRIVYIIDTNADMSDVNDRVTYSVAYGSSVPKMISTPDKKQILTLHADNNTIVYYYESEKGDGIAYYDFATASHIDVTANGVDIISPDYDIIRDSEGNITAVLYSQTKTWTEGAEKLDGSALYGIFRDTNGFGKPIEISTDLLTTVSGAYISQFDGYIDQNGNIIITAEYVDSAGSSIGRFSDIFEMSSSVSVVDYEIDYTDKLLVVELINNGAIRCDVHYSVDGGSRTELASIGSGDTVYAEIRLESENLLPKVSLYESANGEEIEQINDINLNYVDLRPAVKQILLGANNILLVAVRNDGNLPSSGRLYVRVGNYTVDEMYVANVVEEVRQLNPGDIVYFEIPLTGDVDVDENTIVTVYVSADAASLEKGATTENNILYTTLKAYDKTVDGSGASYAPEILSTELKYDSMADSGNGVEIVFTCSEDDLLENIRLNGSDLVAETDYSISVDGVISRATISSAVLSALPGGDYSISMTIGGKSLELELEVVCYHKVTWIISDTETVTTYVEDGKAPSFDGKPERDMTDAYTYAFIGWDSDGDANADKLKAAYSDAEYSAVWNESPREYTVAWVMTAPDGTAIVADETYAYGDIPNYVGIAFAPEGMVLNGWNTAIVPVVSDTVYTAVYTEQTFGSMTLNSEAVSVKADSEFEVTINASNLTDIAETTLKLTYDTSVATLLGMEIVDGVELVQIDNGYLILKLTVSTETNIMQLVKLRMKTVKAPSSLEHSLFDAESDADLTKNFGSISIFCTGDVNLDGIVSAADVTMLAKHLARFETISNEISMQTADTNDDGVVTAADLTRLAQYIAKIISSFEDVE